MLAPEQKISFHQATAQSGQKQLTLSFQVQAPSAQLLDAKSIIKINVMKRALTRKITSQ